MAKRLERDLEADIVRWAIEQGGEALKLKIEGRRGFPDRTILLPGGIAIFPEVKRDRGSDRRAQQIVWIERLQELGFAADFVTSLEQVEAMKGKQ